MERFFSDQSSLTNHDVVNYCSSSYGRFLFRSPYSPPSSPSPSPFPSIASLSQLFLEASSGYGSRSPLYCSSMAGCLQLQQPPLLPLPKLATLPAQTKRIPGAIPSLVRSMRQNAKRKGKIFAGARKGTSPPPAQVKEERIQEIVAKEEEKVELCTWPLKTTVMEKKENKLIKEEDDIIKSLYSLSPPPSSLPLPRFSLLRLKVDSGDG